MSPEQFESRPNRAVVRRTRLLLRLMVVLELFRQLPRRNLENVGLCLLTLLLLPFPGMVQRWWKVELPPLLEIVLLFFLFAAQIMGEIQEFYLLIPCWDTILHGVNGFLFASIGYGLLARQRGAASFSAMLMALAAFCFSMTIGVLWEFFEWGMDSWFGFDMQKDTVVTSFQSVLLDPGGHNMPHAVSGINDTVLVCADGSFMPLLLGGYLDLGLADTMLDLLVNLLGAAMFCVIGYAHIQSERIRPLTRHVIPRPME